MTEPNDDELIILPSLMSYRDNAPLGFAPPVVGSIEAIAVRRRRRRIVTGAAAAVVVLTGVSMLLANAVIQADGSPPPIAGSPSPVVSTGSTGQPNQTSSRSPAATDSSGPSLGRAKIPIEAMLTASDLGDGYTVEDSEYRGGGELASLAQFCDKFTPLRYTGPQPPQSERRFRGFEKRLEPGVGELMSLTSEPHAKWYMAWVRDFVADCKDYTAGTDRYTLEVLGEGFAGQDSIIVGQTASRWVFVRQGELIAELFFADGQSVERLTEVARSAADRMCEATAVC